MSDDRDTLASRLQAAADDLASGYDEWTYDVLIEAVAAAKHLEAIDRTWDGYTLQPKDVTDRVERTRLLARGQLTET